MMLFIYLFILCQFFTFFGLKSWKSNEVSIFKKLLFLTISFLKIATDVYDWFFKIIQHFYISKSTPF